MKQMNILTKAATVLIGATMLMAGCVNEDIRYDDDNKTKPENVGYLSLSGLNVEVMSDTEVITGVKSHTPTRAESVDPSDFTVDIVSNKTGEVVTSFKYADKPAEPIELEVGNYTLNVYSGKAPDMAWEAPTYGASKEFVITRLKETSLGRIVCKLSSIKISVTYSADIIDMLSEDTNVNIALDQASADFGFTEERAAYFRAPEATNQMDVTITGSYKSTEAGENSSFEMTSTLTDVKPGQWRKITIIIEHASEGDIDIRIEVENWTFDEVITVDTSSELMETVIDDNDGKAPEIVLDGGNIDEPFTLTDEMFDQYGDCTEPVRINLTSENPMASLQVEISSTDNGFMGALEALGIPSSFDMCEPGAAGPVLNALGYPTGDDIKGKNQVSFNLQPQMKQLYAYKGTHSFKITATDEKGGQTVKTLVITTSAAAGGPTIVWVDHDIDTRYTITDGLDVAIDITSETGIKEFIVTINSDTLTPSELESVGLKQVIDLINPGELKTALEGLGFPTEDQVLNQKKVSFSITAFLPLLQATGTGDHDFVLDVKDDSGQTIKTLMLKTE